MTRKTITTIYVDEQLIDEAKRRGLNISGFVNQKLSEHISDVRKGEFARADEIEKQLKAEIAVFLRDVGKDSYHKYLNGRLTTINLKLGTALTKTDLHAAIIEFKEKGGEKDGKSDTSQQKRIFEVGRGKSMQEIIQLAVAVFLVVFIANMFKKELLDIIGEYKRRKKDWDKDEPTKPKV